MSASLQQEMVQRLADVLGWDASVVEGVVEALMDAATKADADKIVEVKFDVSSRP
jgi:hypothetical protein